jgi:hypothetical protein
VYEDYADELEIELVPETGHFTVDEKPDLVDEPAMKFFPNPE